MLEKRIKWELWNKAQRLKSPEALKAVIEIIDAFLLLQEKKE